MKNCMRCKQEKNESQFFKESCRKDGLCRRCKQCESERRKKAYLRTGYKTKPEHLTSEYKEKLRLKSEKWYRKNKEKVHEKCKMWAKKNREKVNLIHLRWRIKNPEQVKANSKLQKAVKSGTVIRPNKCQFCEIECKPQGHHYSYNSPLNVIWLCKKCHEKVHHGGEH